jgi:hydroxyethylthiazole kinase-like uncharacterized protein yjeF
METGLPLYRSDAVRAIDRAAIAHGIAGFELMRRAAQAAFDLLRQAWPEARGVSVVCGSGNNGGDGYLVACLARDAGLDVAVHAAPPTASSSADARRARAAWSDAGGIVGDLAKAKFDGAEVIVDALFGIGLTRAPDGDAAHIIALMNASRCTILALDVPSGIDADTGATPGNAVRAARTITFIAAKRGVYTGRARELCGTVTIAPLQVPRAQVDAHAPDARLLRAPDLARWLRPRARDAHKGHHGHVLAIGGEHGYGGAIQLCAQAALRSGAGWVSVATRADHIALLLAARPEAMSRAVESDEDLLPLLERADVLAIGPGLGQNDWGRALFARALKSGKSLVLDADALNLLALSPMSLHDAILTPHPGEAARLLGCTVADIEADRFAAAHGLAERFAATVVLKGAGSIVAAPGQTPAVIDAGNPGMASAGMGDVLTGAIAALRAQGLDAFDAACAGALLHAAAGDIAARDGGERGLLAGDLFIPLRKLANPA